MSQIELKQNLSGIKRCPNCAVEIPQELKFCEKCAEIEVQRRPYLRQLILAIACTLCGYGVAFFGTVLQNNIMVTVGMIMGFGGGIWIMVAAFRWLRTGESGPIRL